jgi:dolichyl-phosphate beta-glucosyltransferase
MPATLIVVPCYRERDRLPRFLPDLCRALHTMKDVQVRVVDDGSGSDQQAWLADYVDRLRQQHPVLDPAQINARNRGKGGAVYSGWDDPGGAERLGFVDADGAVPATEVARVLSLAEACPKKAVFAVRTGENGTKVNRKLHRNLAGAVFRWLVRRLFHFPLPDTQCGFKLVPAGAFAAIRPVLQEERYTFDVELTWHLLRRGVEVETVPVNWSERPGSHLRPVNVWAMYQSLKSLRRRLGDWRR